MRCAKCNSYKKSTLQRVNDFGVDGIWWCEPCIEKHEPELLRNILEDESQVEKDLKDILRFNYKI